MNDNVLSQTLLIVDDQGAVRKLVRLTLGYGIYRIYEADNGDSALHLARSVKPDVMVLDVMMPGAIDGLELCRLVRADPDLKSAFIVMISARGRQADIENGKTAGADAYLVKPFSPIGLIETIENRLKLLADPAGRHGEVTTADSAKNQAGDDRPLVICIDDDTFWAVIFRKACERAGARPLFVDQPETFKRAVLEQSPAGVILDQVMPDSSGAELVMWLRGLPAPPRVLLVAGDPLYLQSSTVMVRSAGLVLAGSLLKPLRLDTLAEAIGTMLPGHPG